MELMDGGHCAENIKNGVEKTVNIYEFDKNKITGNFSVYNLLVSQFHIKFSFKFMKVFVRMKARRW